jgi:hypothetical protein
MKKRVRFVIGFATLVAAGCTVKVNGQVHKFGVSGEEEKKAEGSASGASSSGTSGGSASPDDLAAELAGGTTPAGQSVTLKPDFAPNPTVVGTFSTKAVANVYEQPHGVSRCSGHVGDQATAVIKLTSAMKNTRISAPGARLIVAELGNKQYTCDEGSSGSPPSVMLDEWPAGDVTIFVGGRKDETYTYELRVEDEKRPIDVAWKNNKATEINEVPKDAIVLTQTTPGAAGRKGSRCGDAYFRDVPDVVFSLKRPLGDMSIEVRSPKGVDVELVGPLNDTGRNLPVNCGNDNRIQYNRMEAGIYGLRVGTATSGEESLFHVVVRSKDTARNPTAAPSKFADKIALEESVVMWHYPQLTQQDMDNDANREAIFLSAPKELFVFPKFNMDKSVAEIVGSGGSSREKNAPAPEYPKENEPLLLLNKSGLVMAADGAVFRVNMKDIQADPGGAIVLPAAPRNTWLPFEQAVRAKGPEDEKAYAAWQKAEKDVTSCEDRARNNIEATFESLCSSVSKNADKKKEALEKELAKNRTARRAASLTKIKTRVEALFKK